MKSLAYRKKLAAIIFKDLKKACTDFPLPMSNRIQKDFDNNPFVILMSCILSLRARDTMTYPVSLTLFKKASTPETLLKIPLSTLENILKPLGFFRVKAKLMHSISAQLLKEFKGNVPCTMEELLSIKGVGRKTANLVLAIAYGIPALCVDTHVHRLANQWGLVQTQTPEQTEYALQEIIPKKDWIQFGRLVVSWGQNSCSARSKQCSYCPLYDWAGKIGIKKLKRDNEFKKHIVSF